MIDIKAGEIVDVTLKDGEHFIGEFAFDTSAYDNEPEGASVSILTDGILYELFEDDIADVRVVQ
jgi:hypothetical protein